MERSRVASRSLELAVTSASGLIRSRPYKHASEQIYAVEMERMTATRFEVVIPIPASTLQPPPLPRGGILRRARLLGALERGLHRRVTLVTAPAGYGKTVLLSQWVASEAVRQRYRTAWLTLDDAFCDPSYLLAGLVRATDSWLPVETCAQIVDVLQQGVLQDTSYLLRWLLDVLGHQSRPLLLVLDEVQALEEGPKALHLLSLLISHAPQNLRLALVSRSVPTLPALHKLRAQGQVLTLDLENLRFTRQEVSTLFQEVFELPLSASLSGKLVEQTEGWPVALSLIHQANDHLPREEVARSMQGFGETPPQLYNYLASVVLEQQSSALHRFLLWTSILEELRPELCSELTGRDDGAKTLAQLERQGLFTVSLDGERHAYRYQALFRDFLRRRLQEVEGEHTIRLLHRMAAEYYLERTEDEVAIRHLLAAGDYGAAADLIRPLQRRLFHTSRYYVLARWLEQFPADLWEGSPYPWLLIARGRIANLQGDLHRAKELFRQAEVLLEEQEDQADFYSLYRTWGGVAVELGDFEEAEPLYAKALQYARNDAQRAVVLGWIARCRYMQGSKPEQAMSSMDKAVTLAKKSGHLLYQAGLMFIQGKMLASTGRFREALEAWHTALDLMEAFGNRHQQVGILTRMAYLHALLGDLEQARPLARQALEMAETYGRQGEHAYSLNILGCIHTGGGQWDEAIAYHEKALAIQRRFNQQYEIPVTLDWLAVAARYAGKLGAAQRLEEESLSLREARGNDYETGLSLINLGAIYLASDQPERAEQAWHRALEIFERHHAHYELVQVHYYLAVLALQQDDERALSTQLRQTMRMARAYGRSATSPTCDQGEDVGWERPTSQCIHLFMMEKVWTVPLMVRALRRGWVPACVDCLLVRSGRPAVEALIPLLDEPSPEIRTRAARLLGGLGDDLALEPLHTHRKDPDAQAEEAISAALTALLKKSPGPLRVQTLGEFRLWRGGQEIADWPRKSARDVFIRLLLEAPQPLAAEALAEALWPDSPPDKSAQSLRRAVSALRCTLEPELPSRVPSRYIQLSDDMYTLRLPAGSHVADVVFEEKLTRVLHRPLPQQPAERQEAIAALEAVLTLYNGDYVADLPFEEWTLARREYLRHLLIRGVHRLANLYLAAGDFHDAIAAAHAALAQEHWDEEATRVLMQAYTALGNVPAALRAYEILQDRMRRDLDLPPREDLIALYQQLHH